MRSLIAVAIVFGLLGLFAWLLRRGSWRLAGGRTAGSALTIETAVSLGERRSLVIVAVEGRRLLLGLAPGQVSLVTELQAARAFPQALDERLAGR